MIIMHQPSTAPCTADIEHELTPSTYPEFSVLRRSVESKVGSGLTLLSLPAMYQLACTTQALHVLALQNDPP